MPERPISPNPTNGMTWDYAIRSVDLYNNQSTIKMINMKIETIGTYHYLVEYWYIKAKHRNYPNRIRVSDKLADWVQQTNFDVKLIYEISPAMEGEPAYTWDDLQDDYRVQIPKDIIREFKQIRDSDGFYGENPDIREKGKYRREWLARQLNEGS